MVKKEAEMKEFLTDLSTKYGIPYEKMADLVIEIADYIEKDLPVSVSAQIQSEIGMTIKESTLHKIGLFPIP